MASAAPCADLDLAHLQLPLRIQQVTQVTVHALKHHVHIVGAKAIDDVLEPVANNSR